MSRGREGKRASFRGFKETGTSVVLRALRGTCETSFGQKKKTPPRDVRSLNAEGKLGRNNVMAKNK